MSPLMSVDCIQVRWGYIYTCSATQVLMWPFTYCRLRTLCNSPADTTEFILMMQRKWGLEICFKSKISSFYGKTNILTVFIWNVCRTTHKVCTKSTENQLLFDSGVMPEDLNNYWGHPRNDAPRICKTRGCDCWLQADSQLTAVSDYW